MMTAKTNPLKDRMIQNVTSNLKAYADRECLTAGMQLISDVKKGYVAAKKSEDEDLLWRIHASRNIPGGSSQPLYEFLRKAKQGAYVVNEAAIAAAYDRTTMKPEADAAPTLG